MSRSKKMLGCVFVIAVLAGALWGAWKCSSPSVQPFSSLRPQGGQGSPDLTVRFLGAGTLSFDDGETAIMEDGFFSRPSIFSVLLMPIQPNEQRIDASLRSAGISKLAAIFVAHSHYDHVLDSGLVALKTDATVLGTKSTANAVLGAGLPPERIKVIKDGDSFLFGQFQIKAFETPHSPHPTSPGFIDHPLHTPVPEGDFKVGENFSYLITHGSRRLLVIASGNYSPGKFKDVRADVVFLGIGTLGKQTPEFVAQYWQETVVQTGAKIVIPIHWDNFFEPLDQPLTAMPRILDAFDQSMAMLLPLAQRDAVKVQLPVAFAPIDLDAR